MVGDEAIFLAGQPVEDIENDRQCGRLLRVSGARMHLDARAETTERHSWPEGEPGAAKHPMHDLLHCRFGHHDGPEVPSSSALPGGLSWGSISAPDSCPPSSSCGRRQPSI